MQGVILAAGKGTRLYPLTLKRSKAMMPILGKPIVARVMDGLWENGVRDFILVVSREDREIVDYLSQKWQPEANIRFVVQEERLGMAHALGCAVPFIQGDFILCACDTLVSPEHIAQLMACHVTRLLMPLEEHVTTKCQHEQARHSADKAITATLSLMRISRAEFSRMAMVGLKESWVTRIVEKPSPEEAPSNVGSLPIYVFKPFILDYLPRVKLSPRGEYEIQDAIQMLIEDHGGVWGVFVESRLDLRTPEDLLAINRHYLADSREDLLLAPSRVGEGTRIVPPVYIEDGVVIGEGCLIGPCVYIERGCRIGPGAIIEDTVVLRGSVVGEGAVVKGRVIAG